MSEGMRGGGERERERKFYRRRRTGKRWKKGRRMETPEQFWGQFLI